MDTTTDRLKAVESLLNGYITDKVGEHFNRFEFDVHEYFRLGFDIGFPEMAYRRLLSNGYTCIQSDSYSFEMFNEKTLSNVSYCEGDYYIVVLDNIEDFNTQKESTIQFYKEGK